MPQLPGLRGVDFMVAFRVAVRLARDIDAPDEENLAGDMIEECWLAMRANRINCPTRTALLFSRRTVIARSRRRIDECWADERADERAWSFCRLQALWPKLTDTERAAVSAHLLGNIEHDRRRSRVLDNARRNVWAMLRGEKTRDPKFITSGNLRKRPAGLEQRT